MTHLQHAPPPQRNVATLRAGSVAALAVLPPHRSSTSRGSNAVFATTTTIAPALLDELEKDTAVLKRVLSPVVRASPPKTPLTEAEFRYQLNADPLATELLASGIRAFDNDHQKLVVLLNADDERV